MANTTTASPALVLFDAEKDTRFRVRQVCSQDTLTELDRIGFDHEYRSVAEKKFHHVVIKAHDLSAPAANILKQTCLSIGTDAGVAHGAINCTIDREAVLITATQAQLELLVQKLRPQPFSLRPLAEAITRMQLRKKYLATQPLQAMAVLNVTPDSFSDGGRYESLDDLLRTAEEALTYGADWLDVGGESTRPGALEVPESEELARVIPVVEALRKRFPEAKLSVDTRKAAVAKRAVQAGANMINDVSGLTWDSEMVSVVAETGCFVVVMHSQGLPETMQNSPAYEDVVGEVSDFFYERIATLMTQGVLPQHMILDPGIGFGKTVDHNLTLMRRLPELVSIGFPVLVGTSRKSFLTLGHGDTIPPTEREALTAASVATAVQSGAHMIRVHDMKVQGPVLSWLRALEQNGC